MSVKKIVKEPTEENIYNSIMEDTVGRNKYIWRFCKILNEVEDGYVIGLNAKWGEGKTFFINQVKMTMEAYSGRLSDGLEPEKLLSCIDKVSRKDKYDKKIKPQLCFYYDAWENDADDEPVLSLLHCMAKAEGGKIKTAQLKEQLSLVASCFVPLKLEEMLKENASHDLLSDEKNKDERRKAIDDYLETIHIEKGERAIIFVDELDRCKPNYAVRFLERIKHYFEKDNITFVFSVNLEELQHTVKKYYGDDFDGYGYLRRFFDLILDLPKADMSYYIEELGLDYSSYYFDTYAKEVIKQFDFSVRETEKYINVLNNSITKWLTNHEGSTNEEYNSLKNISSFYIPFMLGQKIKNVDEYNDFVNGKNNKGLLDFVEKMQEVNQFDLLLLDGNEVYSKPDGSDSIMVTKREKHEELYDIIFNNNNDDFSQTIGKFFVSNSIKDKLIDACSMMSDYTLFEDD